MGRIIRIFFKVLHMHNKMFVSLTTLANTKIFIVNLCPMMLSLTPNYEKKGNRSNMKLFNGFDTPSEIVNCKTKMHIEIKMF